MRAMTPDLCFGPGDGGSGAPVVDCAFLKEPRDGGADGGFGITTVGEPLSDLRLRELSRGQPSKSTEVRRFGGIRIFRSAGLAKGRH